MNSKYYYIFVITYLIVVTLSNLMSAKLFGVGFYSLYSSSMEPNLPPGSLVALYDTKQAYVIGDVVGYWSKQNDKEVIVVHRIVDYGGNVYVTKGDNNQQADWQVILPRLIVGKMIFNMPYIGYIYSIFNHPVLVYFVVTLPAIMIIAIELRRIQKLK